MSTATVWLCNFIIGVIVPTMSEDAGFGTYVFFAIMCVLASIWAFFLVPETKGKTLEEMGDVFGDNTAGRSGRLWLRSSGVVRLEQRRPLSTRRSQRRDEHEAETPVCR